MASKKQPLTNNNDDVIIDDDYQDDNQDHDDNQDQHYDLNQEDDLNHDQEDEESDYEMDEETRQMLYEHALNSKNSFGSYNQNISNEAIKKKVRVRKQKVKGMSLADFTEKLEKEDREKEKQLRLEEQKKQEEFQNTRWKSKRITEKKKSPPVISEKSNSNSNLIQI